MAKKQKRTPEQEFRGLMGDITSLEGMRTSEVLDSFLTLAFYAVRGPSLKGTAAFDENEAAYMAEIARLRKPEESASCFGGMLAATVRGLEANGMEDFLGPIFMDIAGDAFMGQFFTPPEVSRLMAHIAMDPLPSTPAPGEVIRIHEPTCGFGGMMLSVANVLREQGIDPSRHVHFSATDIDITCVRAAYIQCTLCALSATIVHGNVLSLETRSIHETLMARLYPKQVRERTPDIVIPHEAPPAAGPEPVKA